MLTKLDLLSIERDCLVCIQHLQRGVPIIPAAQMKAAERFFKKINKEITYVSGSKITKKLKIYFKPEMTDEEIEEYENLI